MLVELQDVATIVTGGTPSTTKKEYWDGDIPWLQSGCCQNCYVDKASKYITKLGYDNSVTKMMPANTILIALTGATAGKIGYLTFEACGNQSITGITPDPKRLLPKFLYYCLIARRDKTVSDCTGGAQQHISQDYVKHMKINLPSILDQKEIVNSLDFLNQLITKENHEHLLLDELIKSRFNEMFSKESNFVALKEITTKITDGSHNPPKGISSSNYIMVSSQNIFDLLDLTNVRYLTKEDFELENKRTNIQDGDVLFTIVGTIGRTHVIKNEKLVFQRSVAVIKPKHNLINSTYLKNALSSTYVLEQISKAAHGVAQMGIYLSDLKELRIPLPSIDEQNEFSLFVNKVDKLKFTYPNKNLATELILFWYCIQIMVHPSGPRHQEFFHRLHKRFCSSNN